MGPNVSCTLVYEWDTPINSSAVFKQVVSVTPLYRYRSVSILPKLYIYNNVSMYSKYPHSMFMTLGHREVNLSHLHPTYKVSQQ